MNPAPDYWSTLQQVRRILRYDLHRLLTDILLGFVFILASYAVSRASQYDANGYLITPMVVTSLCVLYLNARLIAEEASTGTIQFYANLPRDRMLTFWTRTLFVIAIGVLYYLMALAGLAFKNHFDRGQTYSIRSLHWAMPIFTFIISVWVMYLVPGRFLRNTIWITCFAFAFPMLILSQSESNGSGINLLPLALLSFPYILWITARSWNKVQAGGLS